MESEILEVEYTWGWYRANFYDSKIPFYVKDELNQASIDIIKHFLLDRDGKINVPTCGTITKKINGVTYKTVFSVTKKK